MNKVIFPKTIKFKEFDLVTTGYKEKVSFKANLPINVNWVKYEGQFGAKYIDHVYYWTIIPNTFHNKRELAKARPNVYKFKKKYLLIVLEDTPIIPELKIVSWEKFKPFWKDLIFTEIITTSIDEKIKVAHVFELIEVPHPKDVKVRIIDYCNAMGQELCQFSISNNINLLRNFFHCKQLISWGNKANDIWKEAMMRFYDEIFDMNHSYDFDWELKDLSKSDKFFNQFK